MTIRLGTKSGEKRLAMTFSAEGLGKTLGVTKLESSIPIFFFESNFCDFLQYL